MTSNTAEIAYTRGVVPGQGGDLTFGRWGTGNQVVVASHGITANHLSWDLVGRRLATETDGAVSLVAIDHRGRAGSARLPGPFGLAAHADDLIAIMDGLELDSACLVGHSMGGFVAALTAEHHADRIEQLVLVDGGLPFQLDLPADIDPEEAIGAVIGPALARLDQRWDTEDDYVQFFVQHPAFQPPSNQWWPTAEAYVRYDAVLDTTIDSAVDTALDAAAGASRVRSSVSKDAVVVDGGAVITDPESSSAIERIANPTTLLWAPRGLLDQTPGLYPATQIASAAGELPHLHTELVDDTNHYTILVGDRGATAVAKTLAALFA